ncbi:pyruvate dehydrogenase phosphatase regulatory subunit, mitochondrial-like isoform X2 [Lycorma delicatula]|uniref:pyruvate dehydrogenase phosphatase regulatory subunit, mitochondrial-like isoform X2 n=1 Tax=Lycorma delicatula TaxID=130591 RepID=UPI003F51712C
MRLKKWIDWRILSGLRELRRELATADGLTLPTQAQVVICGAGAVANSVAYHLTENGWRDIVVLEQGSLCSGTSYFGSGTLGLFKPIAERNIIMYSIKLYQQLQEKGYDIGLVQCGSLNLAQTKDRMIYLKRRMAYNLPTGLHCEMLGQREINKLHPLLHTDDLEGAIWVPEDAVAKPQEICRALVKLSKEGGARFYENCAVERILTNSGRVSSVTTNRGIIHCEYFVNCAGMWARELGEHSIPKVRVPAYPAQHFYITTGHLSDITPGLPCIRDYDSSIYAREYNGGFMVGGFETEAKPAFINTKVPANWRNQLPQDWDHFRPYWEKAIHRIPSLKNAVNPMLTNSPDNFTPNGKWIVGETPEINNYFVAVGMNGNSLQGAGGIGKAVADWVVNGEPTQELLPFDVQRFLDLHNNRNYLQQRVTEVVGRNYAILYPTQCEYKTARRLRCSPLYSVLETRGAVFGVRMGYERPLYFDSTYKRGGPPPTMPPGTYCKPKFFDFMQAEFVACREGVGIIDMSSFSKIEIKSQCDRVVDYLQKLCSNDVNIPVGGIAHTGMQNERGGYENDCILVRQTENCYFMVSPTSQQTRVYEWMRRNLPKDSPIVLNDVTSMYTVINVVGPKARLLMSELSNSDINLHSFTYKVGQDYGARDVGCLTQRFMRIEKFLPFWAEDLNSITTPFEAGAGYRVKLDKGYFIGKFALQRQKEQGVEKRLAMFVLEDIDPDKDIWPWGYEPIYRNDQFVGIVTSAGYGFTLNKLVCLGYIRRGGHQIVTADYIMDRNATYTIDVAGRRVLAKAHISVPQAFTASSNNESSKQYRPKVVTSLKA